MRALAWHIVTLGGALALAGAGATRICAYRTIFTLGCTLVILVASGGAVVCVATYMYPHKKGGVRMRGPLDRAGQKPTLALALGSPSPSPPKAHSYSNVTLKLYCSVKLYYTCN